MRLCSPHTQQQPRKAWFFVWNRCSPHTPKKLLGPKDGEDEQQSDAEDDSQQVGKDPELRVAETPPQRVVAGAGDGDGDGGRGHVLGAPSLAPRPGAEFQRVDPGLAQEVAALGLVLETELAAFQDDVVGLQVEQGEHGSVRGQVSDRLSGGQHSGLATERTQQPAPGRSHQAEVGQALHAERVAAVQHFGGVERVVEGVPAHRALRLPALLLRHPQTRHWEVWQETGRPGRKGKGAKEHPLSSVPVLGPRLCPVGC